MLSDSRQIRTVAHQSKLAAAVSSPVSSDDRPERKHFRFSLTEVASQPTNDGVRLAFLTDRVQFGAIFHRHSWRLTNTSTGTTDGGKTINFPRALAYLIHCTCYFCLSSLLDQIYLYFIFCFTLFTLFFCCANQLSFLAKFSSRTGLIFHNDIGCTSHTQFPLSIDLQRIFPLWSKPILT